MIEKDFGSRLHSALGGGSIRQIADSLKQKGLNIDYASLRRYILNERRPGFDTLVMLARACDKTIDWLITGDGESSFENTDNQYFFDSQTEKQVDVINKLAAATKHHSVDAFQKLFQLTINPYLVPFELANYRLHTYLNELTVELPVSGRLLNSNRFVHHKDTASSLSEMATVPERVFVRSKTFNQEAVIQNSYVYVVEADDLTDLGIQSESIIVCSPFASKSATSRPQNIPTILISENKEEFDLGYTSPNPFERRSYIFRRATDSSELISANDLSSYTFNQIFGMVVE